MGVKVVNCNEKTVSNKSFPKLMIAKESKAIFLVSIMGGSYMSTTLSKGKSTTRNVGDRVSTGQETISFYWEDYNEPLTLQNE